MDASEGLENSLQNMSVQDNAIIDEHEFNDLRNSVMGGALHQPTCIDSMPIISANETVHDIPDIDPPSIDPTPPTQTPIFPTPLEVITEDDLIGKRASITYEDSLKQLATFLMLPVQSCPYRCNITNVDCLCLSPFEVSITSRGTASILKWTCPIGHIVWRWSSQPTVKYGMLAGDFMLATNILLSGSNYSKVALLLKFMNMGMVDHSSFFTIQDTYCVDTIKEYWTDKQQVIVQRLKTKMW
ncbi:hypothetical protein PFLUV_G00117620 [Perca fluviatilis]|uniref:Uncharacterized protein n=1 Tax=Perca fluviatilis TaxID=8168 RepID=A0A6A5F0Z1_PERFL|nr:hypothetical protein PFLUV_G00117620 [Perca fluviatilis]